MTIIKLLILVAQLYVAPRLLGNLITYKDNTLGIDGVATYVLGLFASFGLFQVVFLPFSLLKGSFTALCWTYGLMLFGLCGWSFYLNRECYGESSKESKRFDFKALNIQSKLYFMGFVVVVIAQLFFAMTHTAGEMTYDDYEYVVAAQSNIATDRICSTHLTMGYDWLTSPRTGLTGWITFTSYLAKISEVDVATICHTVLPVVLLLVAYAVYYCLAKFLFKDEELRLVFMLLLAAALTFGFYSHNALSFRLFATLWQGKAVFASIVMPTLLIACTRLFNEIFSVRNLGYLLVISIAAASLTLYGSMLTVVVMVAMTMLMSIYKRHIVGVRYTLVCSIMPIVQAALYLYIFEVVYAYGAA